jgi:superfamily I DNA/RNA helicase
MKQRIAQESDYEAGEIFDAPISTFHAHCQKILERHGHEAPQIFGIDQHLTSDVQVMESRVRERQHFQEFIDDFREVHGEYRNFFRIVRDDSSLLDLVKSLAAKGIIPEEEGWFGKTEDYLDGDFEEFKELFKEKNRPQEKKGGKRQSELRKRLYSYKWKNFTPDAPELEDVRGGYGTKQVRKDFCEKAFKEDREELKEFIHTLYREYMDYCLTQNYLNFSFLMILAYILLYEEESIRKEESFDYIMIDEFQDTNEIQFKLALLLSEKENLCVVGDWKQSIYSFQYAAVENIQEFESRLEKYASELEVRAPFPPEKIEEIKLKQNYRSKQQILDTAEKALELPAYDKESVRSQQITSLESQVGEEADIKRIESEEEAEAILKKIQRITENYDYGDIAVLTRTRKFGLDLQEKASEYGIPAAYEGGVELFTTNPALILLAWLRTLQNKDSRKGWAVILEGSGYKIYEAEEILEEEKYPEEMMEFREELDDLESIEAVAEKVFQRYGYSSGFTEKIIEVLGNTFSSSYLNLGQLINFIEDNIEEGEIYEVDVSRGEDSVKIQTIHAAKGLEYPVVFISDVNKSRFPNTSSFSPGIIYRDPIGIRQKKIFRNKDYAYNFDNWRVEILEKCLSGNYDEERRLMYVAMTRAEEKLFITAGEKPSTFFTELEVEKEEIDGEPEEVQKGREDREVFNIND